MRLAYAARLALGFAFVAGAASGCRTIETTTCTPGKVVACACADGAQGAQACKADGSGFLPCGCAGSGGAGTTGSTTSGNTTSLSAATTASVTTIATSTGTTTGSAMATCSDTIQDGTETGVDCGGPTCPKCSNGQKCASASDCVSGLCNGVCASPCGGDGIVPGPSLACENITALAMPFASAMLDPAAWAVDQNLCTSWNAGALPPQSFGLDFGAPRPIRGVTLIPDMQPDGNVVHSIETSDDGVTYTPRVAINQFMQKNGVYAFDLGPGIIARLVRVSTTSSPSWVGWFEVAVFSCP